MTNRIIRLFNSLKYQKTAQKKESHEPLISVIIASYNYSNFITTTIDSVLSQTYKNYEIIIIDDGSTDDSRECIGKYVKKHNNVHLYTHPMCENKGLPETLKLGIRKSKGEYIAFCESDDYWHQEHLARKVRMINKYDNVNIILNGIKMFGDKDEIKFNSKYLKSINKLLREGKNKIQIIAGDKKNIIPTFSAVMIKSSELKDINFNSPIPAWIDFWLYRQVLKTNALYYLRDKLTYWRMHKSFNCKSKVEEYGKLSDMFIQQSDNLIDVVK